MAFLDAGHTSVSETLFSIVKQSIGQIRGAQGHDRVSELFEQYDISNKIDMINLIEDLHALLEDAAKQSVKDTYGVQGILRKERTTEEVYNYIYGLSYLSPKYTLLFQDTPIEQLSPGQRGALLLIFYLLVDKGRNPIVLDQPEENLDNETVVSLLVPVLNKAKETRQIFMVTHNPNLAVVCDAEQIIFASFDRKSGPKITYSTGSIENPTTNKAVVDVLEGTIIAFKNREGKYH